MADSRARRDLLRNTSRCPVGHRCEGCGSEAAQLAAAAVPTPLGTVCLTLCGACRTSPTPPPVQVHVAERIAVQHAMHVGLTGRVVEQTGPIPAAPPLRRAWP